MIEYVVRYSAGDVEWKIHYTCDPGYLSAHVRWAADYEDDDCEPWQQSLPCARSQMLNHYDYSFGDGKTFKTFDELSAEEHAELNVMQDKYGADLIEIWLKHPEGVEFYLNADDDESEQKLLAFLDDAAMRDALDNDNLKCSKDKDGIL